MSRGTIGSLRPFALQRIQLHLPQPLHLVPELRLALEFEVGCGFAHFAFEVLDDGGQVGADFDLALPIWKVTLRPQ